MGKLTCLAAAIVAAGALAVTSLPAAAQAKKGCVNKASEGTNTTEDGAKFQAFEALLQATDWGLWAAWMANGSTPGYDVAKPQYRCTKGSGLGYTCRAQTTICKKA